MPERVIVNYGVYRFSTEERESYRVRVFSQIEKKPEIVYENYKTQVPRTHYGYAQLMIGEWVVQTIQLEYEKQLVFEWANDAGQTNILLHCLHHVQRDNIVDLSTCIPTCVLVPQTFPIFGLWRMPYDRILFKLYSYATVLVNVEATPFQQLCEYEISFAEDTSVPFEPSETNVPENPLDPGYDVPDAPYEEPDDNGETYNPQRPEPPLGPDPITYVVTVTVNYSGTGGQIQQQTQVSEIQGPLSGGNEQYQVTGNAPNYGLSIWVNIVDGNGTSIQCAAVGYGPVPTEEEVQELIDAYEIVSLTVE